MAATVGARHWRLGSHPLTAHVLLDFFAAVGWSLLPAQVGARVWPAPVHLLLPDRCYRRRLLIILFTLSPGLLLSCCCPLSAGCCCCSTSLLAGRCEGAAAGMKAAHVSSFRWKREGLHATIEAPSFAAESCLWSYMHLRTQWVHTPVSAVLQVSALQSTLVSFAMVACL